MNLNHLALFHAVAEEGSMSRGAERLFISQPAVSKQIKELETALGTPLFDRLPRGLKLTPAGVLLAGYARRLFAVEAEAEHALRELRGLTRGRLTLGASLTIGDYLLPPVLGAFHRQYPEIEIQLEIANTQIIQQKVSENLLDFGLTEGFADEPHLSAEVFSQDEIIAIVPPGHPLLKCRSVTSAEFCAEPLLLREPGSGTREVVERALARLGIAVTPTLSLGSTEAIKRSVAAGLGIALVSRLAVAAEIESGLLYPLPLSDLSLTRPLHLVRLRGKSESAAVLAFLATLNESQKSS